MKVLLLALVLSAFLVSSLGQSKRDVSLADFSTAVGLMDAHGTRFARVGWPEDRWIEVSNGAVWLSDGGERSLFVALVDDAGPVWAGRGRP